MLMYCRSCHRDNCNDNDNGTSNGSAGGNVNNNNNDSVATQLHWYRQVFSELVQNTWEIAPPITAGDYD